MREQHAGSIGELHKVWRGLLSLFGAMAIGSALMLFVAPPEWRSTETTRGLPMGEGNEHQASDRTTSKRTTTQSDPSTFCTVLVGVGVVLIAVAANGRKLIKISADGAEFFPPSIETIKRDERQATALNPPLDAATPSAPVPPAMKLVGREQDEEYQVYAPDAVPIRVLHDVAARQPSQLQSARDVAYAFRKQGQGNHRWYLRLKDGAVLSVSYGGQGKTAATVDDKPAVKA